MKKLLLASLIAIASTSSVNASELSEGANKHLGEFVNCAAVLAVNEYNGQSQALSMAVVTLYRGKKPALSLIGDKIQTFLDVREEAPSMNREMVTQCLKVYDLIENPA